MGMVFLLVGVVIALVIAVGCAKLPRGSLRLMGAAVAVLVVLLAFLLGSIAYVSPNEVGIVVKNAFGARLTEGKIIATNGQTGVQADVLAPGWHVGYWPIIYAVRTVPLTEIKSDQIGLIEAADGLPLEQGQLFAADFEPAEFQRMLDAKYFLTDGKGRKGPQVSVLTPGKYRINTDLFKVKMVPITEVVQGEVGVLKANFGKGPSIVLSGVAGAVEPGKTGHEVPESARLRLAGPGEMGVRAEALPPGKYPLNTDAYTVLELWTTQMIAHYTKDTAGNPVAPRGTDRETSHATTEDREIIVRTTDGFTFPVDVRVEYVIEPKNAPVVVAKLGDDEGERFRNALNSAVRAIFRNNAEGVKALDYVQQRSMQESQSLTALAEQMARFGVTVTAVRIGNVGDEETLGTLLKTQTDRELAKQEQLTYAEQQKAAEQKKLLSKATQEAEEEKRLATASYQVKIADEEQKKKLIEATAEAQSIKIKALAQAEAYRQIAEQIGKSNAALIELLKIVGERGIQITPRIMISGGNGAAGPDAANTALVGTMLDAMMKKEEEQEPARPAQPRPQP